MTTLLCSLFICLFMSVSAYVDETGAPPFLGITASGVKTRPGVAACPPSMPFGTILFVAGRPYVCLDRGNLITEGFLDLWYSNRDEALAFGRQTLPVVVLWPPLTNARRYDILNYVEKVLVVFHSPAKARYSANYRLSQQE